MQPRTCPLPGLHQGLVALAPLRAFLSRSRVLQNRGPLKGSIDDINPRVPLKGSIDDINPRVPLKGR